MAWRDAPLEVPPTVLLIGGFLTSPPFYWPLRDRLLARGAAAVVTANTWTPDWLVAGARGLGPIVGRAASALERASVAAEAVSGGAPILVIGHSAGGIVARLLTSEAPFSGRRFAAAEAIGGIVTLGSPHHVAPTHFAGRRVGRIAARFADRHVPGTAFAPTVGYVSVASRAVVGRAGGNGRERVAHRLYQGLLHDEGTSAIEGDGVVPVRSALLDGAVQIVLDDVAHGHAAGFPWYGSERGLDGWWAAALEAWRAALAVRAGPSPDADGIRPGRPEPEPRRRVGR